MRPIRAFFWNLKPAFAAFLTTQMRVWRTHNEAPLCESLMIFHQLLAAFGGLSERGVRRGHCPGEAMGISP